VINFWELPGPYRFVTEIVDDLREGRNVFIFLPDYLPKGTFHLIQKLAKADDLPLIERICAPAISNSSPSYDLQLSLNLETEDNYEMETTNLYKNESFKGRIIWIDELWNIGEKANLWIKFFKQYSFVCSNYDLIDRTLFVVPIKGSLVSQKIPTENLFTQHWYWGKLSIIDVQIYTAQLINALVFESLENQLSINVISSLCGFDIDCIKKLCENWLSDSENIPEILSSIGTERNWTNEDNKRIIEEIDKQNYAYRSFNDQPPTYLKKIWGKGMLNLINGRIFISPIVNSLILNSEEIRHRIWRGHAQTLLPIIDEYRIKIIGILKEYGLINIENGKNENDILEIGTIKYRIDSNRKLRRKIDKELLDLIRLLTKIRNNIAHLKIISKQQREKLNRIIMNLF
jgi:hypothetical protein